MNTVVIIQARLTSTRLPEKVLKPIAGVPSIQHTVGRAALTGFRTVLAIPTGQATLADQRGWQDVYGGPEYDVLARVTGAAMLTHADIVVRLTGDCPFVDPRMVWACAHDAALKNHYVSNCWPERTEPKGLDVEAFPTWALVDADLYATTDEEREHVTPWIQQNVKGERLLPVTNRPDLRWVLDTQEDYDWFCKLATMLDCTSPHPTTRELLAFLKEHPEMERRNDAI